jgi:hypothetical protein
MVAWTDDVFVHVISQKSAKPPQQGLYGKMAASKPCEQEPQASSGECHVANR